MREASRRKLSKSRYSDFFCFSFRGWILSLDGANKVILVSQL